MWLLFPSVSFARFIAEIVRISTPQKLRTANVGAVIINLILALQVILLALISEDNSELPSEVPRLALLICL